MLLEMAHDSDGKRLAQASGSALAWFQRRRLKIPAPIPDYLHRPALVERAMPTNRRVVLLKAPGGFGKTALLAECCRTLSERGIATAWLCVDASDDLSDFETHLALAFRHSGIELPDPLDSDAWNAVDDRIGLLLRAVEDHAGPCVLALDEVDRLIDADAVEALSMLMRRAPPNLHIAIACRELPPALDMAEAALAGQATMLSADELRFTKPEIANLFELRLSREQLASLSQESAGWPVALRIYRNEKDSGTRGEAQAFRDVLGNWLESRLWLGLSDDDGDFLLDLGLFDRIDTELIDEVLEGRDSRQRLHALVSLVGLIEPGKSGSSNAGQLHPLLRDHCAKRRFRETPERFRWIHRRTALALERRGETIPALRHAAEAGDRDLVGRILEAAGGLRFWFLHGPPRIRDAEPFLTPDVVESRPRLALARCAMLVLDDRMTDAKRAYDLAAAQTDGFTRNPTGDDRELRIDHCLTQEMIFLSGCTPISAASLQATAADLSLLAQDHELEPTTRGALEFGLCAYENQRAKFDATLEHAERSRQFVSDGRSPYLAMQLDFQLGNMAMAQGQVDDAETWYTRGLKTAKADYRKDATPFLLGDVLLRELELERNRLAHAVGVGLRTRDSFARAGNTFTTYAAKSAVVTELAQHAVGVDTALSGLSEMWEYARRTDRSTLTRYLSALRVSILAGVGRVVEAERTWRAEGLPEDDDDCLGLVDKNWREVEALACARLRLLTAQEAYEPARQFARRLLEFADAHRLVRTLMRGLAVSMTLEHRAGNADAAVAHLAAFLHRYATTDYARPVVREGEAGRAVLNRLLESNPNCALKAAAEHLIDEIGSTAAKEAAVARFTARELEVLRRLAEQRDKEIGSDLGITHDGVRYHVRRIFAKLDARSRHDAVHRARAIGLLPAEAVRPPPRLPVA